MTEPKDNVIQFKARTESEESGFPSLDDETIEMYGKITAVSFKLFWSNLEILYGITPEAVSAPDQTLLYNAFVGLLLRQAGHKHQLHDFADRHHACLERVANGNGGALDVINELNKIHDEDGEEK